MARLMAYSARSHRYRVNDGRFGTLHTSTEFLLTQEGSRSSEINGERLGGRSPRNMRLAKMADSRPTVEIRNTLL